MTIKNQLILIILFFLAINTNSQVTNVVILDKYEINRLRNIIDSNENARQLFDSIVSLANVSIDQTPRPLETILYEGLLDNDPGRINTMKSFQDIDNTANLIYACYGIDNPDYGKKAKQILLAWASTYQSDGNTINENKFISLFWGYYLFKSFYTPEEMKIVEQWMNTIAINQKQREQKYNNNWEAKRLKIIGIIGCILQNEEYTRYSVDGYKKYISTAYYADGTSNDLTQRDALHYHIGGLKPCLSAFINLSKFEPAFNLYSWESPNGSSVKRSVEFLIPYATGEKVREEWKNSKVELDKKRAVAGLKEYQPGMLFNRKDAYPLVEWACFYHPQWYSIISDGQNEKYTSCWIGLLNSPVIRGTN